MLKFLTTTEEFCWTCILSVWLLIDLNYMIINPWPHHKDSTHLGLLPCLVSLHFSNWMTYTSVVTIAALQVSLKYLQHHYLCIVFSLCQLCCEFVYIVPCGSVNEVMTFIDLARLFKCCIVDGTIHWISHYTPDEIKANWLHCPLESYSWSHIELALRARPILESLVWFQTK